MKTVVYIMGAGATQAEAAHAGSQNNLLMKNNDLGVGISERVLGRALKGKKHIRKILDIEDETDIEKLISLLTATGAKENIEYAGILRENYHNEIIKSINEAGILYNPEIAVALLQMHKNSKFSGIEKLLGIISLNHDNLFQEAFQTVHSCVNLGFEFISDDFNCRNNAPFLIQLHGSFSWRQHKPIRVVKIKPESEYDPHMTWIPPSILKETKDYPFNKLTGLAYELLADCDILRIVGCSLSQNDWNLISLIFNAQNAPYNDVKKCFKIEIIMDIGNNEDDFLKFKKEISYLKNVTPIYELNDGDFSSYKMSRDERTKPSELDNPFEFWLRTKVKFHVSEGQFDKESTENPLKQIIGL
jgi:hypothetical protein